jgi:hypothetical protein
MDAIISCKALSHTPGINTDHLLILTTLDLDLARAPSNPLKNFRNVDWEEFDKALSEKLNELGPPSRIRTPGELEATCSKLTEAIQDTINNKVPTSSIGIKSEKMVDQRAEKAAARSQQGGMKSQQVQGLARSPSACGKTQSKQDLSENVGAHKTTALAQLAGESRRPRHLDCPQIHGSPSRGWR